MKTISELAPLVKARFVEEEITAAVLYGRKALGRKDNQGPGTANRVIIAPGTPDGARGKLRPRSPRNRLQTDRFIHARLVTIQVWGYDGSAPSDEAKQDDALEFLFQATMRAIQDSLNAEGHGAKSIYEAECTYPIAPTERVHGAMCQVILEVEFNVRAPTPNELIEAEPDNGAATLE